jgi:hypothetical protein
VLHHKYIGVEVGDDLLAGLGQVEIAQGRFNVREDDVPIKLRVIPPQIARMLVVQHFVHPRFFKFIKQRVHLLQVAGIAHLADQIRGPQQTGEVGGAFVVFGVGHGKAGQFHVLLDHFGIDGYQTAR